MCVVIEPGPAGRRVERMDEWMDRRRKRTTHRDWLLLSGLQVRTLEETRRPSMGAKE